MKRFAYVLLHNWLLKMRVKTVFVCLSLPAYKGHLATDLFVGLLASRVLFKTAVKCSPSLQRIHQRQDRRAAIQCKCNSVGHAAKNANGIY